MPVESKHLKKLWSRPQSIKMGKRSNFWREKRRIGAFHKESQQPKSTMLITLGSHWPPKTKNNSKNLRIILMLTEVVHQLPSCRGRSKISLHRTKIISPTLIRKAPTKTVTTSPTSTSGWAMKTSSRILWRGRKVLLNRIMLSKDLSWLEELEKPVVLAKTLKVRLQLGRRLKSSRKRFSRITIFIRSMATTNNKITKTPSMISSH